MRSFNRSSSPKPSTFDGAPEMRAYEVWNYSHLDKSQIRDSLHELQGGCCAYCERLIGKTDKECHIEHLWRQNDFRERNVDWENMFLSCNTPITCGKHKDKTLGVGVHRGSADDRQKRHQLMEKILDPSRDNPEDYLQFVSDGWIRPRSSEDQLRVRAEETIGIFELNSPGLRLERENAVSSLKRFVDYLMQHAPDTVEQFVQTELQRLPKTPFSCTIRAYLSVLR